MSKKTVLILVSATIAGNDCNCGELVSADEKVFVSLIKDKQVSDDKDALESAIKNGVQVRELDVVVGEKEASEKEVTKK